MAQGERLDASKQKFEILDGSLVDSCEMLKIHAEGYKNNQRYRLHRHARNGTGYMDHHNGGWRYDRNYMALPPSSEAVCVIDMGISLPVEAGNCDL